MQPDLGPTITEIRAWHRKRCFAMEQRKRSDLALGSYLRSAMGWSRSLPKAEAEKIKSRALDMLALGEKVAKGKATGVEVEGFSEFSTEIMASVLSRSHWDAIETAATKEMERLAKSLPVWGNFAEGVRGFGARSLAVIVAEAGDLSNYPKKGHLWKRMGLAVMDGVRQGGLRKSAAADEWIEHGYNAKRRSQMFVIGDVLVKVGEHYRAVYLARKEYERARAIASGLTVAPAAKIPAKRKDEFVSDGHIHLRAQRYMEKMLLRDLLVAWKNERKATGQLPLTAKSEMPTAHATEAVLVLP